MKYQWVKGDNQGILEEVKESDNEWVTFNSGRRISQELINEYMIPINHESQIIDVPNTTSTQSYSFSQDDTNNAIRDAEGNVYTVPKEPKSQVKTNKLLGTNEQNLVPPVQKETSSPIKLLIRKSLKDKIKVSYEFEIEIPKTSVYDIINDSFDVELESEILEEVISKLNMKDIKTSVEEAIANQIMLHYNK
jgi:lipopolysaccharide export LptBFGC system permease protein LptF